MTDDGSPRPQAPPGWYPAPEGPFERWWDGHQWTAHARPLPHPMTPMVPAYGTAPMYAGPMSGAARAAGWLMAASAGLILIGAMLPWATFGPFTVAGTSGDGGLTLVFGLIAAAAGVWRGLSQRPSGWQLAIPIVNLALGGIVTLIGLADAGDVSDVATVGSGLVLTVLGGMALVGTSIFGLVKQR
jgi:hypothetical protein